MEFASIFSGPTPFIHPPGQANSSSTETEYPSSAAKGQTSIDEANEKIAGYLDTLSKPFTYLATFFTKSLVGVGSLVYLAGECLYEKGTELAKYSQYHGERIGYVLAHSKGTVWDETVWEEKLDNDKYNFALNLASVSNLARNPNLTEKEKDTLVHEAVENLSILMKKLPPNADACDTVVTRQELNDQLDNLPPTVFARILRGFLAKGCDPANPAAPINFHEKKIISLLAKAVLVEHKREAKQHQEKKDAYLRLREAYQYENPERFDNEYQRLVQRETNRLERPLTNREKFILDSKARENLAAQDKKLGEEEEKLKLGEAEDLQRQWDMERAVYLDHICLASWNFHAYKLASGVLTKIIEPEFTPNYSKTTGFNFALGTSTGWKNVYGTGIDCHATPGLGFSIKKTIFVDHEGYRGRIYNLFEPLLNVLGDIGKVFETCWGKVGVSGTGELNLAPISLFGEYNEHGTAEKVVRQQFHNKDNSRENANRVEFTDQWIDSLVNKYRDQLKEYTSRKSGLGYDTTSYKDIYTWDEVADIDAIKQKFDEMEKKMQARMLLAKSSVGHAELQKSNVNVPDAVKNFASGNQANDEKVQALKKAQIRSVFRDSANSELEELKSKHSSGLADLVMRIQFIKKWEIKKLENRQDPRVEQKKQEFSQHQQILEQFIAEQGFVAEEGIYLNGTDETSVKINQLVDDIILSLDESDEQKHLRLNEIERKSRSKEAELRRNEIKVDLAFELMALKGKRAAEKRNQLVEQWKQEGWKQGFAYLFTPEQLNESCTECPADDQKAEKIIAKYDFKLAEANKESELSKLKHQCDKEVNEVKSHLEPRIAEKHAALCDLKAQEESKWSDAARDRAAEQEELEFQRDCSIRKKEHSLQLAELNIEHQFDLNLTKEQQDKTKLEKEHAIKKLHLITQFDIAELKHQHTLKVSNARRCCEYAIANAPDAKSQLEHDRDVKLRELEHQLTSAIKLKEKELQLNELDIEVTFSNDHQFISEFIAKEVHLNKQFEIDQLKRDLEFDIANLEDMPLSKKDLAAKKVELAKQCDAKIKAKKEEEIKVQQSTNPTVWKENKLEELQSRYELAITKLPELDKEQEAAELQKNYQAQIKKIDAHFLKLSNAFAVQELKIELLKGFQSAALESTTQVSKKEQQRTVIKKQSELSLDREGEYESEYQLDSEIKEIQHQSIIDELKLAQLLALLPLQSMTAVNKQAPLLKELKLSHIYYPADLEAENILPQDEEKAQKIIAESNYQIAMASRDFQISEIQRKCSFDVEEAYRSLARPEAILKELELKKKANEAIGDLKKAFANNREAEALAQLASAKLQTKEAKAAQEKEMASWRQNKKNMSVNFTGTDVPVNGAYKTNYVTGTGGLTLSGEAGMFVASVGGQVSGKGKYTRLGRQKPTPFGVRLTSPVKSEREIEATAQKIDEQLDSKNPHVKSLSEKLAFWESQPANPLSIIDTVIDGWKALELKLDQDALRTEKKSVQQKEWNEKAGKLADPLDKKTEQPRRVVIDGYTVPDTHFTVEQCMKYLEADIALYAMCYGKDGIKKGYETTFLKLQERYAAKHSSEVIKHMAYVAGKLIGKAKYGSHHQVTSKLKPTNYVNKKEVIALQEKLLAIESKLFKLQTEKQGHWMDWCVQEFGTIFVESIEGKAAAKAEADLGIAAGGLEANIGVTYTNRGHSVASRNGYTKEVKKQFVVNYVTANINEALPWLDQQATDNLNRILADTDLFSGGALSENPLSIYSGAKVIVSQITREIKVPRFNPLYEELELPVPDWVEAYSWVEVTIEMQGGINITIPLDKLSGELVPFSPYLQLGPATSETNMLSDTFLPKTFNHFDMFYSHARDVGDLNKHWRTRIRNGQRDSIQDLLCNFGKEQFEDDKTKTPLSNEMAVRTLEFKRNDVLTPDKFRDFEKATNKLRTVATYLNAIKNAEADKAANEVARRDALNKAWVVWNQIFKIKQRMIECQNKILKLNRAKNDQNQDTIERKILELNIALEDEKLKLDGYGDFDQAEQLKEIHQLYDDKAHLIDDTLSLARRYFLENGLNPDNPDSCYDHCFEIYENWESAYYPHVRVLFENNDRHETPTVDVNGVRYPIYQELTAEEVQA